MSYSSLVDTSLMRRIAEAEVIHLEHQLLALKTSCPDEPFAMENIAGSITILSSPANGRKLNHTYGLGMSGIVTEKDLRAIERAYEANGVCPELDMCEYADQSALDVLSSSGYTITGSISQFQCSPAEVDFSSAARGNIEVRVAREDEHDRFVQTSIEGFLSEGRSRSLLKALAESAAARSDTVLFFAVMEGEVIATAAMSLVEVDGYKIANMYIDSCLPQARGKGAHKALLLKRIEMAAEGGCDLVVASAREGSSSARNMEKAGLKKAYTCRTYTKRR